MRNTLDTLRISDRIYRSLVHHNGPANANLRRRFITDLGKIIRYENTVFDPPPLEMFTFVFHVGYPGGDGMEHLDSTQIISAQRWVENGQVLSGSRLRRMSISMSGT